MPAFSWPASWVLLLADPEHGGADDNQNQGEYSLGVDRTINAIRFTVFAHGLPLVIVFMGESPQAVKTSMPTYSSQKAMFGYGLIPFSSFHILKHHFCV
jgi:hypothetical protein